MNKQQLVRAFAIATVAFVGSLLSTIVLAEKPAHVPSTGPVPKAHCGPGDRTESGLQGQTTPQERFTGDSELGYNCNLELVGKYQGEGAYSQDGPTFFGDCAYYGTDNITSVHSLVNACKRRAIAHKASVFSCGRTHSVKGMRSAKCSSTTASSSWMPRTPGIHTRARTLMTVQRC